MQIVKYKNVFDHVEISLKEKFGNDTKYDNVVVVLGYNTFRNLDFVRESYPNHKLIIYQLEPLPNSKWAVPRIFNMLKSADIIWDYDEHNIEYLRKIGLKAYHIKLPYTNNLKVLPEISNDADIDILYYGYMNEKRYKILTQLQNKLGGRKIISLFGVWREELDSYLNRSKIIINVHYHEIPIQEQVRLYYPVINGRCIISESSIVNYLGDSIIECPYDNIIDTTRECLNSGKWLEQARKCSNIFKNLRIK